MIDLERDIKITPEDIEIQNRLRRERRPMSMNEYLTFLDFMHNLFEPSRTPSPPPPAKPNKRFEL